MTDPDGITRRDAELGRPRPLSTIPNPPERLKARDENADSRNMTKSVDLTELLTDPVGAERLLGEIEAVSLAIGQDPADFADWIGTLADAAANSAAAATGTEPPCEGTMPW